MTVAVRGAPDDLSVDCPLIDISARTAVPV